MKQILFVLAVFGLLILNQSCKTELDVYAPYQSTTIVTGLLDPSLDTQFVRITRTWQGEGNNLDYALIRDSSEYQWSEFNSITIEEWDNGSLVNTWDLQEIERQDKNTDGIFFGPEYTAYYFVNEGEFELDNIYKLNIDFVNRVDVSAQTQVILADGGEVTTPNQFGDTYNIKFADIINGNTTFRDFRSKWRPYTNAGRYDVQLKMYYTEFVWADTDQTQLLSETPRTLVWNMATVSADAPLTNGRHVATVGGESFYTFLKNNLEASPYISRQLGTYDEDLESTYAFDYVLNIANPDLDLFMEVSEPVTNIIQERPAFTNISNGLGIFASRVSVSVDNIGLRENTVEQLIFGENTIGLNFCYDSQLDSYSSFDCD